MNPNARIYVIGTPIGNLEDLSFRALRVLKEVCCVICEDTRHTRKLLSAYELSLPTVSLHQHSSEAHIDRLLDRIETEGAFAYVTDAGTPGISDPGAFLVAKARARHIPITPIPGPSAVTTLLSVSGFGSDRFFFAGFPPHKKGREKFFSDLAEQQTPIVLFESKYRLQKTLDALLNVFGPERRLLVGRELTKMHEELQEFQLHDAVKFFASHEPRGEFVLVIARA